LLPPRGERGYAPGRLWTTHICRVPTGQNCRRGPSPQGFFSRGLGGLPGGWRGATLGMRSQGGSAVGRGIWFCCI